MQEFVVCGGKKLYGEAEIRGAKNSVLPVMAAAVLSKEECVLERVPLLEDVFVMCELLRSYGVKIRFEGSTMFIDSAGIKPAQPDEEFCKKVRASSLLFAPLLHRLEIVSLPVPGGCAIGARPLDYHLNALGAMGAEVLDCGSKIILRASGLRGKEICLDFPSVGATENIMMAAALAYGTTVIRNAAREPEIVDLAAFLNKMGACIIGAGCSVITVEGVNSLHGTVHRVIPDRIELATLMTAVAMTGGDCLFRGADAQTSSAVIAKLRESGISILEYEEGLRVIAYQRPRSVDIISMPYPGFPTDMQPQMMAMQTVASGISVITETVFENRFRHIAEMQRFGAKIKNIGNKALVFGREYLRGAVVEASDLRAGAALLLMAMAAEGESVVKNAVLIDRGYQQIEKLLSSLGADIIRNGFDE